ncbi:hypothetical protein AAFF_G00004650 [Aldrovandia affinis]|uniref:Uncharacterized protein n=1 Tax=Aldrovandia affinis TaxID=143900 RepID=A0AAD7TDM4_9TELE|nr:hypothetical protein AAFF_G00004650 [Aldrovandia affinis]
MSDAIGRFAVVFTVMGAGPSGERWAGKRTRDYIKVSNRLQTASSNNSCQSDFPTPTAASEAVGCSNGTKAGDTRIATGGPV